MSELVVVFEPVTRATLLALEAAREGSGVSRTRLTEAIRIATTRHVLLSQTARFGRHEVAARLKFVEEVITSDSHLKLLILRGLQERDLHNLSPHY